MNVLDRTLADPDVPPDEKEFLRELERRQGRSEAERVAEAMESSFRRAGVRLRVARQQFASAVMATPLFRWMGRLLR